MYKNAKPAHTTSTLNQDDKKMASDFESEFINGAQTAGVSLTKTVQLASVLIGTVTKVTSAFGSVEKTSA